eukprot:gene10758-22477_t
MHRGDGRGYLSIESYVRAGRSLMDALGIHTEHPDVCNGLTWRYIKKKRWIGAEGGWENPFPSGNATEEFYIIQTEMALAQSCIASIIGDSGYAWLLQRYLTCGFPHSPRGELSKSTSCMSLPTVLLEQRGFNCEEGNKILCNDQDVGGNIMLALHDPSNMLGANYSLTKNAYKNNPLVTISSGGEYSSQFKFSLEQLVNNKDVMNGMKNIVQKAKDTFLQM